LTGFSERVSKSADLVRRECPRGGEKAIWSLRAARWVLLASAVPSLGSPTPASKARRGPRGLRQSGAGLRPGFLLAHLEVCPSGVGLRWRWVGAASAYARCPQQELAETALVAAALRAGAAVTHATHLLGGGTGT